jgi:serine/threonine protein kinase/predicted Zn-dependent protease
MRCPECNTENSDTSRFCSSCGVSLVRSSDPRLSDTKAMKSYGAGSKRGETFAGKYRILQDLGRGGMGVIQKAEDVKLKRPVVLKLLPPELTRDPEARQRFMQEARAASALDHVNICTIYEIDETADGQMYIAMAYYPGKTLKEKIERGPLRVKEAVDIAVQIARGLARAHEAGIVHRDIKPANIIVTDRGEVKILDFGLAKLAGQEGLTQIGIAMGTVIYMSPEQARGEETDGRTDVWALGVVLYEMLSGRLPFRGDRDQAVIYSILNEEPEPLSAMRTDVPPVLERIVRKAMSKQVADRFTDVDRMLSALKEMSTHAGAEAVTEMFEVAAGTRSRAVPLSAQKPIAVISFENQTGEAAYDYLQKAIPNLLITSLEQSKYLRVVTWERMYDLLKQMGKDHVDIIDRDLGFELCRMEGIDSVVVGSYVKAGEMFATDVKVLDVETKNLLKSASSKGEGVDSILKEQIDALSREVASGLGVLDATRARGLPIAEVATASMEAYNWFLKGVEQYEKLYNDEARRSLERAAELDPQFAAAYLYLAWTYDRLREVKAEQEAYEKAKALAGKATRKQRLYIEAEYARAVEQDEDKRLRTLKQITDEYPDEKRARHLIAAHYRARNHLYQAVEEYKKVLELDPNYGWAMNELAYMYADTEAFDKAAEYLERYAAVSPGDANPVDSMGELYFRMGKLDEAIGKYKEALELKPDFYYAYWEIAYVQALKEDYDQTLAWMDRFIEKAPSPATRASAILWKCFFLYWLGSLNLALEEARKTAETAEDSGNKLWAVEADRMRGWIHYDRNEVDRSRECFQSCIDAVRADPAAFAPVSTSYSTGLVEETRKLTASYDFSLAIVDLKAGDVDAARVRLDRIKSIFPDYYCLLHGEILLAEGTPDKAITVCEKAPRWKIPYMSDRDSMLVYNLPALKDTLARAFVRKGDWGSAIREYVRLTTVAEGSGDRRLIHPKYHFQLAGAYEEAGQAAKAEEEYGKFLDQWKDADPSCPEIEAAREHGRHHGSGDATEARGTTRK